MALAAPIPAAAAGAGTRVRVQRFGTFLSNMVMPNIGAFIAWGLITALFIQTGWLTGLFGGLDDPGGWVAKIGGWGDYDGKGIVGPMITYLLPTLIGYTGGKAVYGVRGGVVGAIATMGVITGTDIPMFMGAMLMGPLGGYTMRRLDALWADRIRPGFEMLVDNFSAGIWGGFLAAVGFFLVGPVVESFSNLASHVVNFLVGHDLLPLTSLFIEPAKVLFLNNAVNHGILTPLGTSQAAQTGKSILFLLEANPGPGLGLLLAYALFGKGLAKASAPGAIVIEFIGGIHEIYFPYVLMKPRLILATVLGGMTGVAINVLFHVGLRAPAAPGSIIAVYAQTATGSYLGVTLSVLGAAAVSCLVASFLLRIDRSETEDLVGATADMEAMKGRRSVASSVITGAAARQRVSRVVFACDAGMGSSAMGASTLRRAIKAAGLGDVTVVNQAISDLTDDADIVVTHRDLTERARLGAPSAVHVSVDDFLDRAAYDDVVALVKRTNDGSHPVPAAETSSAAAPATPPATGSLRAARSGAAVPSFAEPAAGPTAVATAVASDVLPLSAVLLDGRATTRDEAITEAGMLLVDAGVVAPSYVEAMHERERSVSTHMGRLLAIPHGTQDAKAAILRTGVSFVRYTTPIDWDGRPTYFVVGVAGRDDDHLTLLDKVAQVFLDDAQVQRLHAADSAEEIRATFEEVSG